jgi:hypothetical protein
MFKKISFVVVLIIMVTFSFANQILAYSNQSKHYSFDLPSGWEEIPKSAINQYTNEAVKQTNGKRVEFSTGFHLVGSDYFSYPYILVQEHETSAPSFSQLESAFNSSKFQRTVEQKTAEYSELLKTATSDKPFIDKGRNIVFMNIKLDVANIGQVNGLIAMFLGKNGITQINFYSLQNDQSEWLPVFNSIIDSFKYDEGFAYNLEEAEKNNTPSVFEGVVEEGIGGAIVGGILGLIAVIVGWIFRKRSNKNTKINSDILDIEKADTLKKQANVDVSKNINVDKELTKLRAKSWYRFLKVVYILIFCMAVIVVINQFSFIEKIFPGRDILINCENYKTTERKASFSLINVANAGRLYQRGESLELKTDKEIENLCSGKNYYVNISFQLSNFLILIASLLFIVIIFELFRQIGYYIFLGKFYPHRSYARSFKR